MFNYSDETFFGDSSFGDKILNMVLSALLLIVLFLLGLLCCALLDEYLPTKIYSGKGIVKEREFVPSHTTTTLMSTGKTIFSVIVNHPDAWLLYSDVEEEKISFNVTKEFYESAHIGDSVSFEYSKGYFSSTCYSKSIWMLSP